MTTLVVCVDRTGEIGRKTGRQTPITGEEELRSLVLDFGLVDPEDSGVNAILETLQIAASLDDAGESVLPAVVSGSRDSMVSADRAVAEQLDALDADYDVSSAIVVIDSAQDERLVPIVESRFRVDSVDRVVVRQARDLESTYYLLKQFLADEELRQTILVPLGIVLLVFPALTLVTGMAVAVATITAVLGVFLIYKGVGFEAYLAPLGTWIRQSLYSGQVSVVTYVVAIGLLLVGMVAGGLSASEIYPDEGLLLVAMQFIYDSVFWVIGAGLVAASGRLLDLVIQEAPIKLSYLNLPFVILGVGLVLRGFTGFLLASADLLTAFETPPIDVGVLRIESVLLSAGEQLAIYVSLGVLISVVGVRIASYLNEHGPLAQELSEGEV